MADIPSAPLVHGETVVPSGPGSGNGRAGFAKGEAGLPSRKHSSVGRIVCVANQKGGVGKTTTASNLAAGLAKGGLRTLLVDLDPQCNATTGFGGTPAAQHPLVSEHALAESVTATSIENLSLLPGSRSVRDVERIAELARGGSAVLEHHMAHGLGAWDYCLIDCPPSLNLLTVNAMVAAHSVLVPLQCEFFALEGLSQLMLSIREVRQSLNPELRIEGVVLTMYDSRNNLSQQVESDVRENLGDLVFNTIIPRNVRLSEAPSFAMPALIYDHTSKGSIAYQKLAAELLRRHRVAKSTPNPAEG